MDGLIDNYRLMLNNAEAGGHRGVSWTISETDWTALGAELHRSGAVVVIDPKYEGCRQLFGLPVNVDDRAKHPTLTCWARDAEVTIRPEIA